LEPLAPSSLTHLTKNPALLLIDMQTGLDDWAYYGGNRNNPDAEKNAAAILAKFREFNYPIFHVRHSSTNPKSPLHASKPGFAIKKEVAPMASEPLFTKNVNSAFIGTDLEDLLRKQGIEQLVVVGLTTNHCVSTSVRMAANLGFEVILISDATATFDRVGLNAEVFPATLVHETSLASLHEEFALVLDTETLTKQLVTLSGHPQ